MSEVETAADSPQAGSPSMSLIERFVAVFTRPSHAWGGLETRAQWWFPMLVLAVVSVGITLLLHERALLPMMSEAWDQQVADGQMTAAQADGAIQFMAGPAGMALTAVQQAIAVQVEERVHYDTGNLQLDTGQTKFQEN
jgi:hypothetical protein